MLIRKARLTDFDSYCEFRRESLKELSKIAGEELKVSLKTIKKEFYDILKSRKRFFFLAIEEGRPIGLLIGTLIKNVYLKIGYIDDLFVKKEYRRKGVAQGLINNFIKLMKNKKIMKIRLSSRINNLKALNLYKKLGFKIKYYELEIKV